MIQSTYTGPVPPSKDGNKNKSNESDNIKKLNSFDIRIIRLLAGDRCRFNKEEFDELIKNMDNFNINTLSIQKSINRSYYCEVDDATVELYRGKE